MMYLSDGHINKTNRLLLVNNAG